MFIYLILIPRIHAHEHPSIFAVERKLRTISRIKQTGSNQRNLFVDLQNPGENQENGLRVSRDATFESSTSFELVLFCDLGMSHKR